MLATFSRLGRVIAESAMHAFRSPTSTTARPESIAPPCYFGGVRAAQSRLVQARAKRTWPIRSSMVMAGSSAEAFLACLGDLLFLPARQRLADQLALGNKQVAEWVGQGKTVTCQEVLVGVTDTDDVLDEVRAKGDAVIILPDRDSAAKGRMGTRFMPNMLAIIKGCPNREGTRKLIDLLLGPVSERQLT
jgi:hypothetical protein